MSSELPGTEADGLRRELRGATLWLTLDRPDRANTFTRQMQRSLIETFDGIDERHDIRAVVITAAGDRHFCGGPDLQDPDFRPRGDRRVGDASRTLRDGSQRVVSAILDCEKPVICGLNGVAVGGGANFALAADLVIASENARIVEMFTKRGLVPDGGAAYLLTRHLPRNVVKELILFGDDLSADDAARWGLFKRVVPPAQLHETLVDWSERLSSGPTRAFQIAKQLLNDAPDVDRSTAFALEAALVEQIAGSDDVAEGVAAFLEKRPPSFRGS